MIVYTYEPPKYETTGGTKVESKGSQYDYAKSVFNSLPKISNEKYRKIHTSNLVPLPLKIDCDLLEEEIKEYDDQFEDFCAIHLDDNEAERYSLGLTDLEHPVDLYPSPVNWPIDIWISEHPNQPLFDTYFKFPNQIFKSLKSLEPMMIFENHLSRCCLLKWHTMSRFKPHFDVKLPAPNFRLWGTNDPENNHFCFWDGSEYVEEKNVERGRLYLADTSKYHHAYSTGEDVYTFFFSLQISAYDTLLEMHPTI